MNFTSQICTTEEQSKRLLALGLKKETADCFLVENPFMRGFIMFPIVYENEIIKDDNIPAWSLHRLIELCAIPKVPFIRMQFQNTYDEIISLIAEAIKLDAFNKEYLEE